MSGLQPGTLGVNSCNADGFTPLHVAALHGHSALVALLIRHGANVNARTNQSATPLHLASQNCHVQVGARWSGKCKINIHVPEPVPDIQRSGILNQQSVYKKI